MKQLVLLGGGHSHVEVIRQFGLHPAPETRITVIGRERHTPYSGMLPGYIAGHYRFEQMHMDLVRLAKFARAAYVQDEAVRLDLTARRVICRGGEAIPYDVLSINSGITPNVESVPGAAKHVTPVKPISRFLERWELLRERVRSATGPLRLGVVGGGAGGVEVLLAMQYALAELREVSSGRIRLEFFLVNSGQILQTHNGGVRRRFARILQERDVNVLSGRTVTGVEPGRLLLAEGEELPLDEILWVTQASAAAWPGESGLAVNGQGFIRVADTLESLSHPGVFAAGDVADVVDHPREKAGVFAVRQGPPLAANLRRALQGEPPVPFTPQKKFLSLISTGDRYAVASYGPWSAEGHWVWRWKDWIDRRFMTRYHRLYGPASDQP
jgi:selenide,water dikinase